MSIWFTSVTVLLLILPALSQIITTTCEIPSVEAGDDATLTIHIGDDLIQKQDRDFRLTHLDRNDKETRMLDCEFSYGTVKCKKTPCCTWESKVMDVFRVYIHNASQQLEGTFWGFITPGDTTYHKSCNFTLKASTCLTDPINATNSQVTCNNQSVTIGQSCTMICNSGHYFQENQISVTYTCVGRNKWSPEIPVTSCEAPTCSRDSINATNSRVTCDDQSLTIGQKCTVICNPGHYFQENQIFVTYICVGKNQWFPEIPIIYCEGQPTNLYFLFLLPIVILIVIVMRRLYKECQKKKNTELKEIKVEKRQLQSDGTEPLLPVNPTEVQASKSDQGHWSQQSAENYWLQCIKAWYPELHRRTYFLPPLHFNRVPYSVENIAGEFVLVAHIPQDGPSQIPSTTKSRSRSRKYTASSSALNLSGPTDNNSQVNLHLQPVYDKDVRGDKALERVLHCLRALADNSQPKEVMMVISQLQFGKYLGQPSYAATAALLPRPSTLPKHLLQRHYHEGDFDVLIIHRQHGLFILEIRSVGANFSQLKMTEQQEDDVVMKKVKEALKQLNKSEVVLRHLTSDLMDNNITKILAMPNISSTQLLRAISRNPFDGQGLCQCLGVRSVDDTLKMCLLSDQLPGKRTASDVNHTSLKDLCVWWQQLVKMSGPQASITETVYEHLVARFCGPATTVEVHCVTAPRLEIRIRGEAVSATGETMARLVLFPQQVELLNRSPPGVFLIGPPGTGKTIVLIVQGLTWLQLGHDVHIVSTWSGSCAVTIAIERQLKETMKTTTANSRVHRHPFDFKEVGEVETAVRHLKALSEGRQLCVIADEAIHDYRKFTEFCDRLFVQVPGVFLWGASVHHEIRPLCLEEVKLTTPLRSPPVVVREVMEAKEIKIDKQVHDYTVSDVPVPTDGPAVIRLTHRNGQSGHTEVRPRDCVECGHQVARVLTELNVGRTVNSNSPPPLQYRDVLVLCNGYPTDDRVDSNGQVTTKACGLVRGLRACHVPVRVVDKGDEAAIRDTALGVSDLVTVTNWRDVQGLERKVVIVENTDISKERLNAMSRCTSQLVLIVWSLVF